MSAVYNSTVQGFYLSYYGRPADPAGLTFWTGQLAAAGGNLSSILNAFGTSAEATRRYGTGTTESKIQAVYQQTFGRAADAAGLAFYNTEITAGRITLIDMSKRIIDGATGDDVSIRNNRLSAAQSFTDKLDTDAEKAGYSGSGAEDAARAWVATVTKDAATVTAAVATADSTITSLLPQTFTLTTNQDKWTGSAGNDSVSGGPNTLASADTLGATDQIDGGAGTDTANFTVSKDFTGFTTGTGFMKNVETVNLTNSALTVAYTFTARAVTDVQTYNVSGPVNLAGLSSLASTVNLTKLAGDVTANRNITIAFDQEAVAGTSDAYKVGLNAVGTAPTSSSRGPEGWVALTTAGVETLTLDATGANYVDLANSTTTSAKNLIATGTGSLTLATNGGTNGAPASGVSDRLETLDASGLKGALDVHFGDATGVTSVKGGEGNDTFRIVQDTNADLTGNAVIDGGAGTNTLRINTANTAQTTAFKMSNVQNVTLDVIAQGLTFSMGNATTPLTKVTVSANAEDTVTSAFAGLGANALAIDLATGNSASTSAAAAHTVTADTTGAVAIAVVSAAADTTSSRGTSTDNVSLSKATSATFTTPATATYNGNLTLTAATSATVNVAADGTFRINQPAMKSLTINQTSASLTPTINLATAAAGAAAGATVHKLESLTLNLKTSSTVNVVDWDADGNYGTTDVLSSLTSLNISTEATYDAQDGAAEIGSANNLKAISSVTLGGTVSTAAVRLGDMGANDLKYGITVQASGLSGKDSTGANVADTGVRLGNILVGQGQAITLNIGDVNGSTLIGALTVTNDANGAPTGAVTVNAKGHGDATADTLKLGTIQAATVSLDFNGATGAVTTGAITGTAVTVDATDAASTVVVGLAAAGTDITTKDSLVFKGPGLGATTLETVVTTGSKIFTANLTGGALADAHTITSNSTTQESITVTGDLGVGATNSLTIVSTSTGAPSSSILGQTINVSGLSNSGGATITTGSGKDTITGTGSADTIRGKGGADTVTLGAGNDIFILDLPSETGLITNATGGTVQSVSANSGLSVTRGTTPGVQVKDGYTPTGGDVISVSSFDRILDFAIGDKIVTNADTFADQFTPTIHTLGTAWDTHGTANKDILLRGTFDATANTFTLGNSGASMLYIFDNDGNGAGANFNAIVLVGYATTITTTGAGTTGLVGAAS